MSSRSRTLLNFIRIGALAAFVLVFAFSRATGFRRMGEEQAKVWFYDESSQHLFVASREAIPPSGAGVRAVVVTFKNAENDPNKRRIAYLEKYRPELKELLERVKAARAAQRPMTGRIPPRESPFFEDYTLVRRVGETEWYQRSSVEGRRIVAEWQSWLGAQGERPIVSVP